MELTDALVQYCALKAEVKELRERIDKQKQRLQKIKAEGVVSDTVKGTRKDGTIGLIKITGYPVPEYVKIEASIKKRISKMHMLEEELEQETNAVEDLINQIPKSDLRMMFRFYYLDNMTWSQVAMKMNNGCPKRRIAYTEESCRKRHNRYLNQIKNRMIK